MISLVEQMAWSERPFQISWEKKYTEGVLRKYTPQKCFSSLFSFAISKRPEGVEGKLMPKKRTFGCVAYNFLGPIGCRNFCQPRVLQKRFYNFGIRCIIFLHVYVLDIVDEQGMWIYFLLSTRLQQIQVQSYCIAHFFIHVLCPLPNVQRLHEHNDRNVLIINKDLPYQKL